MHLSTPRWLAIALIGIALGLAGCSETQGVAQAQANLEQAKQALQEARTAKTQADEAEAQNEAEAQVAAAAQEKQQAKARYETARSNTNEQPVCTDCGTISTITPVQLEGSPSYIGTIAGGVAGAAVGSQIGSGTGNTIATIAGTLGGAFLGREIEQRVTTNTYYKVQVGMDAGGSRSVTVPSAQQISVGTRVRVQNGNIVLM